MEIYIVTKLLAKYQKWKSTGKEYSFNYVVIDGKTYRYDVVDNYRGILIVNVRNGSNCDADGNPKWMGDFRGFKINKYGGLAEPLDTNKSNPQEKKNKVKNQNWEKYALALRNKLVGIE